MTLEVVLLVGGQSLTKIIPNLTTQFNSYVYLS